jgi:hypothetical protein
MPENLMWDRKQGLVRLEADFGQEPAIIEARLLTFSID